MCKEYLEEVEEYDEKNCLFCTHLDTILKNGIIIHTCKLDERLEGQLSKNTVCKKFLNGW